MLPTQAHLLSPLLPPAVPEEWFHQGESLFALLPRPGPGPRQLSPWQPMGLPASLPHPILALSPGSYLHDNCDRNFSPWLAPCHLGMAIQQASLGAGAEQRLGST